MIERFTVAESGTYWLTYVKVGCPVWVGERKGVVVAIDGFDYDVDFGEGASGESLALPLSDVPPPSLPDG